MTPYDAILIVGFGGPEGPEEVMPFLENVLRGKNVPRERMLEVAEHYQQFGGVSPINAQVRAVLRALVDSLNKNGPPLPVYWGNRNWHPMLADTIQQMAEDGIKRVLAWFTSPYSSYSSCRQYLEDLEKAAEEVRRKNSELELPVLEKLRGYYNHPLFLEAEVDCVRPTIDDIKPENLKSTKLIFTAHSIPTAMAENCDYEKQLRFVADQIAKAVSVEDWHLVFQSRSGPPHQPWLEPDICDFLKQDCLPATTGCTDVVIAPIGFISDHIEVLYDLDTEAKEVCDELGLNMIRTRTVETNPNFIEMIRHLIEERVSGSTDRAVLNATQPQADVCPNDCCPSGPSGRP